MAEGVEGLVRSPRSSLHVARTLRVLLLMLGLPVVPMAFHPNQLLILFFVGMEVSTLWPWQAARGLREIPGEVARLVVRAVNQLF